VPGTRPRINAASLLDWRRRVAVLYAEVREVTDPSVAHGTWVAGRDELLATHEQSPIPAPARSAFSGLAVAPYDPARRFVVEIDTDVAPERLEIPTGTDGTVPFERTGVLHVPTVGDLDVWWMATYGGGVFVPVKDALAGAVTYGGGRYLIDTVKGADLGGDDGALVVDLNFAYNPSCAYDPAWACPLAPPGNTVPVELPVGELTPATDREGQV
jgi:uncharacterized protein (DUF1684 family)